MKRKQKIARNWARLNACGCRRTDRPFGLCPSLSEIKRSIKKGFHTRKYWAETRYFA